MPEGNIGDLSSQVRPIDCYPFACGGFADIWKAEYQAKNDSTPVLMAVKALRLTFHRHDPAEEVFRKRFDREARVWAKLQHAPITPFSGVCHSFVSTGLPALVSPFYTNGSISTYLRNHPGTDRLQLVAETADGLTYLHNAHVVHGDLKSNNILVNDEGHATLCDFGLSRVLESSGFTTKSAGGNCRWMAPELLFPDDEAPLTVDIEENSDSFTASAENSSSRDAPRVTPASDVWAFGMTVLEILTGRFPFAHLRADVGVILYVAKGGLPLHGDYQEISSEVWHVIRHCWNQDPSERPPTETLLRFFEAACASGSHFADNKLAMQSMCDQGCAYEAHIGSTTTPPCPDERQMDSVQKDPSSNTEATSISPPHSSSAGSQNTDTSRSLLPLPTDSSPHPHCTCNTTSCACLPLLKQTRAGRRRQSLQIARRKASQCFCLLRTLANRFIILVHLRIETV